MLDEIGKRNAPSIDDEEWISEWVIHTGLLGPRAYYFLILQLLNMVNLIAVIIYLEDSSSDWKFGEDFLVLACLVFGLWILSYLFTTDLKYWIPLTLVNIICTRDRSIYVFATISLANHCHNIAGKGFILTDYYQIFL